MNTQSNHPSAELIPASALREDVKKLFDYRYEHVSVRTPAADRQALINRNYATFQAQVDAGLGDWSHVHPYDIADWGGVLTEAEFGAWQDIRSVGRVPLWPRFPVGDMVISFGNPVAKVALLCSTEINRVDAATAEFAGRLASLGWVAVAVTGSQCMSVMETPEDMKERTGQIPEGYSDAHRAGTLRGAMARLQRHLAKSE